MKAAGKSVQFEFATATRIVFGPNSVKESVNWAKKNGARAFVITGKSRQRGEKLESILTKAAIEFTTFPVAHEPTTELLREAVTEARNFCPSCVIGFGGGSVIDTGKIVAALLTNSGQLFEYLEVIGNGEKISQRPAPFLAIATTAGTGAEVTKNGVVLSKEHGVKVSMRSPLMLPDCAIVDPLLTHSLSPAVTASTGLDALVQCLEPYVSNKANPMTDAFCQEGLKRAGRSLRKVFDNGHDEKGREDMALTSLFGGLALANAKLGAVHGFAGPLGGHLSAPHGVICAAMLPLVFSKNVELLRQLGDERKEQLKRFDGAAKLLTGQEDAKAQDGVLWIRELCEHLQVPPLAKMGLVEADIDMLAEKASRSSSMKGNPILISKKELADLLRKAM